MEGMLLPVVDEVSQPFWDAAAAGELRVQECGDCGRLRFPPRPMCPRCHSLQVTWRQLSGGGSIYSFVVAHPPLLPAYEALAPFNVVLVELDEDPAIRLVGNLVAAADAPINSVDPATIAIGEAVHVVFAQVDGVAVPRWMRQS